MTDSRWEKAYRLHSEATARLVETVGTVSPERWNRPRGTGKWSPAQVVQHLNLGYEAILREINGGPAMRPRAAWWMQLVFRWTVLPRIMRGGPFPHAKAPRETRPEEVVPDQRQAIAAFLEHSAQFARDLTPDRNGRLTHPYFGKMRLRDAIVMVARHIEHHRRQLLE